MTDFCQCCGQPIPAPVNDPVADIAEEIRHWCKTHNCGPFFGDQIRRSDAAKYIDRAEKTFQHFDIPAQRHRGRVYYSIPDLAKFIVSDKK